MIANLSSKKFWNLPVEKTAELLETDIKSGLTRTKVEARIQTFGRNTFEPQKKNGVIKKILSQFKSPLILILIVAGIVTLSIAHYSDALFIFTAVIINSLLGYWQENKAEKALSELKTYLRQRARVIREGKEQEIDAEEIVPGDILRVAQGDRIAADARIMYCNDLQIDESVLTGESMPVVKSVNPALDSAAIADQSSMIFAGTLVTQGVGAAIVCRTDDQTELGKIAVLLSKSRNEKTPLQTAITKLSLQLSVLLCILTIGVFAVGVLSGRPGLEMFLTAVAIAVSAIPEGLPISMTVILAIGVERMAKRKGVVRKLIAAEALGNTTVILTDKTGTLTMAKMVMSKVIPFTLTEDKLLSRALANADVLIENPNEKPESWRMNGRIMEVTLVRSAAIKGISKEQIVNKKHVLQSIPFNSLQKFSASLITESGKIIVVVFGAPDILIKQSTLSEKEKSEKLAEIDALAYSGERVLGIASKELENTEGFSLIKNFKLSHLTFDGLITFKDPVRDGIKRTIDRVRKAGVRTIIMTGDHQGTAVSVAQETGIYLGEASVLSASDLNQLTDEELKERLPSLSVIARVTPSDKMRVVRLFQNSGEVVAMTGDGVNDAPSIKQANVGIAMGSGTQVARSVADLVLLDDNFETIVAAIEEGRQILGNIRKVLVYLLSNVMDGLILIGGSILAGIPLPLNALQILWVNFFSDSFPAIAFAFEKEEDSLSHKPHGKKMRLFDPLMKFLIFIIGISTSAMLFVIYYILLRLGYNEEIVKTFTFAAFGTYTLLVAFSVRSFNKSILSYPLFSNRYLTIGILIGFVLMAAAIYLPFLQKLFGTVALPFTWVAGVMFVGIVNIVFIEITKRIFRKTSVKLAAKVQ